MTNRICRLTKGGKVAHALLRAAPALVPVHGLAVPASPGQAVPASLGQAVHTVMSAAGKGDVGRGVETSLDTARTSACATGGFYHVC